jgi:hypothetical protein
MTEIFNILNVGRNDSFPFATSSVSGFNHVPPSPHQLGILPISIPHIYFEKSLSTPTFVILKHDGSIEPCRSSDFTIDDTITIDTDFNNNILNKRISYVWEVILVDSLGNVLVPNTDYELVGSQRINFKNISGTVDVIYV